MYKMVDIPKILYIQTNKESISCYCRCIALKDKDSTNSLSQLNGPIPIEIRMKLKQEEEEEEEIVKVTRYIFYSPVVVVVEVMRTISASSTWHSLLMLVGRHQRRLCFSGHE